MITRDIQKKFSENVYQNYDMLNEELNSFYINVCKSIKNNYNGLLNSDTKRNWLKKLNAEEIFLMNMHDKVILSILDIAIYESMINDNYELLCNGIFIYSRLRSLNRLHLPGMSLCGSIESFILGDKVLFDDSFKGKIEIDHNNWKEIILKQYNDSVNKGIEGKFDIELLQILKNIVAGETDFENNYTNLVRLHSKCRWLTQGWYRECKLINYVPIFLVGVYKLIGRKFEIKTDKKYFSNFTEYLNKNNDIDYKIVYNFTGKIDFLNKILYKEYENFSDEYKNKCHYT
jgi:hypothetical protein